MESTSKNKIAQDIAEGIDSGRYRDCVHLRVGSVSAPYSDALPHYTDCTEDSLEYPERDGPFMLLPVDPKCPPKCYFFKAKDPALESGEAFFRKGTQHDAYKKIRTIIQKAKNELIVVDPYLDSSVYPLLATITAKRIVVKMLSSHLPTDFALEAKNFQAQHSQFSLEIRTTQEFHDRFIIVDGAECYHIGASIKDAGKKAFMTSLIEDKTNADLLIKQQLSSWSTAEEVKI